MQDKEKDTTVWLPVVCLVAGDLLLLVAFIQCCWLIAGLAHGVLCVTNLLYVIICAPLGVLLLSVWDRYGEVPAWLIY
ncbi:hypothetical protein [Bifidobacterium bombi]|uniref:Uncharacterized protein n=1 Tax=Bifidobacterium bombi DSM 19703 TaxID=1341695 RepID=A0A080N3Q4_9BIFI|nr:hypothetical protein [Bifidobacterium bombi]KFF31676.1 hypothetical protein BBOMB_1063 [Bifidobacterium bombi DSM 19703]